MGYLMQYIFDVVDTDGSGTLDVQEMFDMFVDHHLNVDRKQFNEIFGKDSETELNFHDFKKITEDPEN